MTKLNKYVFKDKDNLINLTTHKVLPANSSESLLKENFFLEGQEKQSIEKYLFETKPTIVQFKIISTWECDLRCSHCFVLHQLKKNDSSKINIENFNLFLRDYFDKFKSVKFVSFLFVGGEPALRSKENYEMIKNLRILCEDLKISSHFKCTSNGLKMDKDIENFYLSLDDLCISLDGSKDYHNEQRKSIEKIKNPFKKTLNNIKLLIKLGMGKKLRVQASLEDRGYTEKNILKFYEKLIASGVEYENIKFGTIVPTKQNSEITKKYSECMSSAKICVRQCCSYRLMSDFTLDSSNNFYSDYFDIAHSYLGKTTDSVDLIEKEYRKTIKNLMPIFTDENCMNCPVIGACWGGCSNVKSIKPSSICNQKSLYEKIKEKEANGELINLMNSKGEVCKN